MHPEWAPRGAHLDTFVVKVTMTVTLTLTLTMTLTVTVTVTVTMTMTMICLAWSSFVSLSDGQKIRWLEAAHTNLLVGVEHPSIWAH